MSKVVPPYDYAGLARALRTQRQVDVDGVWAGVSRQAADEAACIIEKLATPPPATPVEAVRVLTRCPDGCFRPKATNADDCAAGCCSKWYAVNDAEAAAECSKLASFWRDPSIQDDAKLWRFCEQSGFPHASYGPGGDGKWRTYWFHRKARGEEFDDPISSVRAAIANQARSEP